MGDRRRHRGPHPADEELFGAAQVEPLRRGVQELSYLLGKGYKGSSALKLVGDHYQLKVRQRTALSRCACSDEQERERRARRLEPADLAGQELVLDGFNVLIGIESALSGALLLRGRDGAHRDLASIHGTYRAVDETRPAIEWVGQLLSRFDVAHALWLLDRPVSNSGRLRRLIEVVASERGLPFGVCLENNPDPILAAHSAVVCSGDSWILDRCARSFDLVGAVVRQLDPPPWLLDLG